MNLKLKKPIIYFDLETTGTDPQRDRIIELATVKVWPDGTREEKQRRFNPEQPIPKEATAVHGITNEDVKNEPSFHKVAKSIETYFQDCDLGGYNIINFDIPLLAAELERCGRKLDVSKVSVIDAYKIFIQKEPRTLTGAVRFYCGKEHGSAHEALGDVNATIDVLEAQLKRYSDIPHTPYEIDQSMRDPEEVDRRGKLKWIDGEIAVNFGRHKGHTLKYLARHEKDYIRWMIENKIVEDAVHHLHDALLNHFATKKDDPK
jgi:DNA polymerase-3 subunit epsilon